MRRENRTRQLSGAASRRRSRRLELHTCIVLGVLLLATYIMWAAAARCMDDVVVGGVFTGILVISFLPPLANALLWRPASAGRR